MYVHVCIHILQYLFLLVSYPSNSQEFQMRQFADLSFLLQSYEQAFLNYSAVKKDFHSSSAMHYAKALVSNGLYTSGKGGKEG